MVYLTETYGKGVSVRNLHTDKAAERLKSMPETSLVFGTLPTARLGEITQTAAFERDGILSHTTLVADNTTVTQPIFKPVVASSAVPAVPPAKSTKPVVPNVPGPVLATQPVDNYLITNFSQIADAAFRGTGEFEYSNFVGWVGFTDMAEVAFRFPANVNSNDNGVFTITMAEVKIPYWTRVLSSGSNLEFSLNFFYSNAEAVMELKQDG